MKRLVAGAIYNGLQWACEALGHPFGCGLLYRGPLRRLFAWALDVVEPLPARKEFYPQAAVTRSAALGAQWVSLTLADTRTGSSAVTVDFTRWECNA